MAAEQITLTETNGRPLIEMRPEATPTPMAMIQIAVEKNYDLDKLERILDLERRWKADRAKEAFEAAMAAFKAEDIHVTKDKVNKQYDSRYTSLGHLVGAVTPFLSKHRLSARWELDQAAGIRIVCILTHELGHSTSCYITFPPDKSGAKNDLQQIKSAITYGKICTFESVCGIASSDANLSDDGNSGGSSMKDLSERLEWIANCKDMGELHKIFYGAVKIAKAANDQEAIRRLTAAKDAKKKELE